MRLPPETKAKLYALSVVTTTPQWRVVNAALECFFRERSASERKAIVKAIREQLAGNK